MKKITAPSCFIFVLFLWLPLTAQSAQTKEKAPPAKVPVTYPGDTEATMARRAQWIDEAKKEGNQLDWWGTNTPAEGKRIIAEFNKVYPFIKVTYWRGEGEEIAAKQEMEFGVGRSSNDIAVGGEPVNYPRWRKMGMLERFTDIIPQIQNLDRKMYSKYGDWAMPGNNAQTPAYNTKLVSAAEAPKNWEDLLSPKWKGQQLGVPVDPKTWWTIALSEGGWGIEKTIDFVTKLKAQQPIMMKGMVEGHALLVAGEFKIYTNGYLRHVLLAQEKGATVDWVRVRPVSITGSAFTLQKKAPHPSAARLFLEWQFSPQGLIAYEAITGKGAAYPGSGTRLSKTLEGLALVYRTEEVEMKAVEMGLDKKFSDILGMTQ